MKEGGMGEFQSTATVLAPVNGKVVTVLAETIGEDDTSTETCGDKCSKWSGDLSVSSTMDGDWPEIQVKDAGVGQRDDKSYGSMDQTKTFKFDGNKYSQASAISKPAPAASGALALLSGDGPSFDCSAATDVTARAICGNAQLTQLDRQMANLYYSHTNYATDPAIRDQQREWIRNRNQSCIADVVCLAEKYNLRIAELQGGQATTASSGVQNQARGADGDGLALYTTAIRNAVAQQWMRPKNLPNAPCVVHIVQSPGGAVVSAKVDESCPYDDPTKASVENAVFGTNPLPYKGFESVFQRKIDVTVGP
jgi:uncharacterized protein